MKMQIHLGSFWAGTKAIFSVSISHYQHQGPGMVAGLSLGPPLLLSELLSPPSPLVVQSPPNYTSPSTLHSWPHNNILSCSFCSGYQLGFVNRVSWRVRIEIWSVDWWGRLPREGWGQMEELMVTGRGNGAHRCKGTRQEETQCVQGTAGLPGCSGRSLESTEAK